MQQEKEASKEATGCKNIEKYMVKRRKKDDCIDLIKKQNWVSSTEILQIYITLQIFLDYISLGVKLLGFV